MQLMQQTEESDATEHSIVRSSKNTGRVVNQLSRQQSPVQSIKTRNLWIQKNAINQKKEEGKEFLAA